MPPISNSRKAADDAAIRRAHAAFQSTASKRLHSLIADGVEGGVASSQLLDDLIAPRDLANPPLPLLGPRQGRNAASSGWSCQSLQHIVACTGASLTHASKILQLREEIARLRRNGLSTANVIEQLHERLRGMDAHVAGGWSEDEPENADVKGQRRERSGAASVASKKRRVGEDACSLTSGIDLSQRQKSPSRHQHAHSASQSDDFMPENHVPREFGLQEEFVKADAYPSPNYIADVCGPGGSKMLAQTVEKRHREESAPLAQLKKLKLRTQGSHGEG